MRIHQGSVLERDFVFFPSIANNFAGVLLCGRSDGILASVLGVLRQDDHRDLLADFRREEVIARWKTDWDLSSQFYPSPNKDEILKITSIQSHCNAIEHDNRFFQLPGKIF
jgi:hypothetical protein